MTPQDALKEVQTLSLVAIENGDTPENVEAAAKQIGYLIMHFPSPTNCFRACVATVLNLPIEDVPQACDGKTWDWDAFQDWLATRNLQAIEMTFLNGGIMYPVRKPVLCIVTGPSPRLPGVQHAVVAEFIGLEGFRLLHDPHMDDLWIDGEPTHATFFVRITDATEHA